MANNLTGTPLIAQLTEQLPHKEDGEVVTADEWNRLLNTLNAVINNNAYALKIIGNQVVQNVQDITKAVAGELTTESIASSDVFKAGVVDNAALGTQAVTTDKLTDKNVTLAKLEDNIFGKLFNTIDILNEYLTTGNLTLEHDANLGTVRPNVYEYEYLQYTHTLTYTFDRTPTVILFETCPGASYVPSYIPEAEKTKRLCLWINGQYLTDSTVVSLLYATRHGVTTSLQYDCCLHTTGVTVNNNVLTVTLTVDGFHSTSPTVTIPNRAAIKIIAIA